MNLNLQDEVFTVLRDRMQARGATLVAASGAAAELTGALAPVLDAYEAELRKSVLGEKGARARWDKEAKPTDGEAEAPKRRGRPPKAPDPATPVSIEDTVPSTVPPPPPPPLPPAPSAEQPAATPFG